MMMMKMMIIVMIMIIIILIITDGCGNTHRQKCREKGSGKEVKIQEFRYRDTTNLEPEMYDYTSYNWSHWNINETLKEKSGSYTRFWKLYQIHYTRQLYLEHHT
jgi:hypothetical protein